MRRHIWFVTGSDTGVGKTVLTSLLARWLRRNDSRVAALKPLCSGGRDDARQLFAALEGALPLDAINPWHFRAPLAPLLAARREKRRVRAADVIDHIRHIARQFDLTLVEGAGGLLSPLGEGFDSRDLIAALRARAIIVCPNRLGAVNQARLVWEALPRALARTAQVVLMEPPRASVPSQTNPALLREFLGPDRVHVIPWLSQPCAAVHASPSQPVRRAFGRMQAALGA
jgi:dethiobiotin synthetase